MKRLINNVSSIVILFGVICLIGSAGASDQEVISITEYINQAIIGFSIMLVGFIGLKIGGKLNV